jgi:hypothetical protein
VTKEARMNSWLLILAAVVGVFYLMRRRARLARED